MRVVITRLAVLELQEAAIHYEMEFPGLGKRFREEVKKIAVTHQHRKPDYWVDSY